MEHFFLIELAMGLLHMLLERCRNSCASAQRKFYTLLTAPFSLRTLLLPIIFIRFGSSLSLLFCIACIITIVHGAETSGGRPKQSVSKRAPKNQVKKVLAFTNY
jgi:hypothetical protein